MPRDLATLPKVDLHVHLEGSMRPSTVTELAARHGVGLPDGLREGRYGFRDFRHFIDQWVVGLQCLQALDDFRLISYEFCEDQASEGIRYAEVSFSLPEHGSRLGDWDGPVLAVLEGFAYGEGDLGITCRPYVDVVRGLPLELSWAAMESAVRHRDDGVFAIGLGGDERHPPQDYAEIFGIARAHGLGSLPHAGETAGPQAIRATLASLAPDRLAHGIRVLEDQNLVAEVRDRGIPLDVCLTSNVMTSVVRSIEEHPLPALLDAGLTVTLNDDDPSMFSSRLTAEYRIAREVFGLDDQTLADLAQSGVRSSLADERTKTQLEAEIRAWLEEDPARPHASR